MKIATIIVLAFAIGSESVQGSEPFAGPQRSPSQVAFLDAVGSDAGSDRCARIVASLEARGVAREAERLGLWRLVESISVREDLRCLVNTAILEEGEAAEQRDRAIERIRFLAQPRATRVALYRGAFKEGQVQWGGLSISDTEAIYQVASEGLVELRDEAATAIERRSTSFRDQFPIARLAAQIELVGKVEFPWEAIEGTFSTLEAMGAERLALRLAREKELGRVVQVFSSEVCGGSRGVRRPHACARLERIGDAVRTAWRESVGTRQAGEGEVERVPAIERLGR
ncbi:MAG: hypothetical protein JNK60_01810 [Acidobacteria bacterium]|nr:hypothetical protein [Acidobacteriota bacterium]